MLQKSGAPAIEFALLRLCATNTSARVRSAEQPRTPGAFAYQASVALADSKAFCSLHQTCFGQFRGSNWPLALVRRSYVATI